LHGDESGMISKLVGMGKTWNGRLGVSNEMYTYDELALFFLCINTGSFAFVKRSCNMHESALGDVRVVNPHPGCRLEKGSVG
jgi:hypothetical protein